MPSNRWNLIVYRAWAPLYDRLLERLFRPGREPAAHALALRSTATGARESLSRVALHSVSVSRLPFLCTLLTAVWRSIGRLPNGG